MGIFSSIASAVSSALGRKQEIVTGADRSDGDGLVVEMIHGRSPPRRGTLQFLRAYKTLPTLGAITRRRAIGVASITFRLFRSTTGSPAQRLRGIRGAKGKQLRKNVRSMVDNGRLEEVDRHPLLDLLERPNRSMTGRSFWILTSKHLDVVGEAFWLVDRDPMGTPIALWIVPPTWVKKVPDFRDPCFEIQNNAWRRRVPEGDMVWLKDHDVEQPYDRGSGPGMALGDEIETDEYAAKMAKSTYFNNATPESIVTVEGVANMDALQTFKQEWLEKHRGIDKRGQPHFVTKAVKVEQLAQTFVETQHNENRRFQRDAQMFGFGMPPEAMGVVENSNRATIESAEYFLAKYGTEPTADLICSELNAWVAKDFGPDCYLFYDDVVPENVERADEMLKVMPWLATVNEHRERLGLEPLQSGGDIHVVTSGLGAVSNMAELAAPSPTAFPALPAPTGPTDTPVFDQMLQALGMGQLVATPLWQQLLAAGGGPAKTIDGSTVESAGHPLWKQMLGEKPMGQQLLEAASAPAAPAAARALAKVSAADMERILDAAAPEDLWAPLEPVMRDLLAAWGERTFDEVGKAGASFDADDPRLQRYLDDLLRQDIERLVNRTTRDQLRAALVDALNNGTSLEEAARGVFVEADTKRAGLIANQSTVTMSERSKLVAFAQAGIAKREWIATPDGRTRDAHWSLDGLRVSLQQPFVVPDGEFAGATAMEPGGFGIAALDINCRCTTAPVIEERASPVDRRLYWRATEAAREPWYDRAERALSRGFGRQMRAVLATLADLQE